MNPLVQLAQLDPDSSITLISASRLIKAATNFRMVSILVYECMYVVECSLVPRPTSAVPPYLFR